MKDKLDKGLILGIVVSILSMIIGYFLWTNLVPIQDFDTLTALEAAQAQKELAINYPVGTFMMNSGFIVFSICLAVYVGRRMFRPRRIKRR